MNYPTSRLRRYRKNASTRSAMQDVFLHPQNFIQPLFVHNGEHDQPISSMPGVSRLALKNIKPALDKIEQANIPSILIFPLVEEDEKDAAGTICTHQGSVTKIISEIKRLAPNLNLMVDLCLCPFTNHGHCGVIENQTIINDKTLSLYGKSAVALAKAGADWVAPSGMMDGMTWAIRKALDENALQDISIMSYSVKFASSFYGPFREAAHSSPEFSDRKSYQMDYKSAKQISLEVKQDIEEGCDATMVKPALAYLDVIKDLRKFDLPLAAYQVSGEYSMLKLAAEKGIIGEREAFEETFYAMRRAGCDWVISYYALDYWAS